MTDFAEEMRYDYPCLNENSRVIDLGGYYGDFAAGIYEKYGSFVLIYEPIFHAKLRHRFADDLSKIQIVGAAVSDHQGRGEMRIWTNSTGFYSTQGQSADVYVIDAADLFDKDSEIDLLKLNIEGEEFKVLPRLLDCGMVKQCKNIQVQFHKVYPNAEQCRDEIRARLAETHEPTFDYPFVWENWRIKDGVRIA